MELTTTEQILTDHINAVRARNLYDIARDYADDAVFITVTSSKGALEKSITKGKESIKDVFDAVFTKVLPEGSSMEFTNTIVEGEVAYITWSAKSSIFNIPAATDTFIIRNGKIIVQTGFTILEPIDK